MLSSSRSRNSNSSAVGRKVSSNTLQEQSSVQFKIGGMATGQCDSIIVTQGEIPSGKSRMAGLARKRSKQQSFSSSLPMNSYISVTEPSQPKEISSPRILKQQQQEAPPSSVNKKKSSVLKRSLIDGRAIKEQTKTKYLVPAQPGANQNPSKTLKEKQTPKNPKTQIIQEFKTPDSSSNKQKQNCGTTAALTDQTTLSRSTSNNYQNGTQNSTKVEVTRYVYDDLDSMMKDRGPISLGINCQIKQSTKSILVADRQNRPNSMQLTYPTKFQQEPCSNTHNRATKRTQEKSLQALSLVHECLTLAKTAEFQMHDPKLIGQLTELKEILNSQMPLEGFISKVNQTTTIKQQTSSMEQVSADIQIPSKPHHAGHKKSATTLGGQEDPLKISSGLPPKAGISGLSRIGSGVFNLPTEPLNPYGMVQQAPNTARTEIYQDVTKWSSLVQPASTQQQQIAQESNQEVPMETPQRSGRRKRSERQSADRKCYISQ